MENHTLMNFFVFVPVVNKEKIIRLNNKMFQYKSLLRARHTANGRTFRHLPKFSFMMSKEDIDIKRVIVIFKHDEILPTDDLHKFNSNIFSVIISFSYIEKRYYRE